MKFMLLRLATAAFMIASLVNARAGNNPASSLLIEKFSAHEARTMDVLRTLAQQAHIGIGVSGELIGSDRTFISVAVEQIALKDVLNEICSKDTRYSWQDTSDGNISVTVGKQPLSLVNVVVKVLKVTQVSSLDVVTLLAQNPDVKAWTDSTKCNIGQMIVIAGKPVRETWNVGIDANNETLWKILNELAVQSNTYFWSVIKFSNSPCSINLNP